MAKKVVGAMHQSRLQEFCYVTVVHIQKGKRYSKNYVCAIMKVKIVC